MTEHVPNLAQVRLGRLPVEDILVVAPAGCGKTEALAYRARAVLDRGEVASPQKILALTYSNKAKANLGSRLRRIVGPHARRRVTVTNFHGLSARIIRAHGSLDGVPRDVQFPDATWRARELRVLGIGWQNSAAFEAALRAAKNGSPNDDQVLETLESYGQVEALAFEHARRAQCRLDYDDLVRHATRLLSLSAVSSLYRAHFGMVMVDEVQDLSLRQLEIVLAVGGDTVTYAGDPAQGIYTFAGAEPDFVFDHIKSLNPHQIELYESYRSSPAVLRASNVLAAELGATRLESGAPERWNDEGHVLLLRSRDTREEARSLLRRIQPILADRISSVGVVVRRGARAAHLREAAVEAGIDFQDWGAPTHVPRIAELLRQHGPRALRRTPDPFDALAVLEEYCRASIDATDVATNDELVAACHDLREMVEQGMELRLALAACREAADPDAPVDPGLHILTGHSGKGQEFDWVVVMGLEEGHIPDFRNTAEPALSEELRLLHVMVSRARYSVILTYSEATMTRMGWRSSSRSPWLDLLLHAVTSTA